MALLDYSRIAAAIPQQAQRLIVGYSGGVDSLVLLHLCATQPDLVGRILAVYVHHGLQAVADDWERHCAKQTVRLGVAFRSIKVDARPRNGESPEAAARRARYAALQPLLGDGDVLLLAQHREDQMETLLLQLFRGAGVQGLAAMPVAAPFGRGVMLRPLLDVGKQGILDYARQHGLSWVDDPSNLDSDFDRNFLRHRIVPLLKQRWPALDKTVARSASLCGEAQLLVKSWVVEALTQLVEPDSQALLLDGLRLYAEAQRHGLLREWLAGHGLQPPSRAVLDAIENQLVAARDDAEPQIELQGRILKKYRRRLYCLRPEFFSSVVGDLVWPDGDSVLALANGGLVSRVDSETGIAQSLWHAARVVLRPRVGGERFKLPGRDGRHELKKLYQEAGIPPWERRARPLLYLDGRLAAVPGLWVGEWACAEHYKACYRLNWEYAGNRIDTTP